MFGFGIAVCQWTKGKIVADMDMLTPVHTFADEETAQGFIEANSAKTIKLQVGESLPRVLYEQTTRARLPNMVAVHLVR